MARNTTPAPPTVPETAIDHPPPTSGGAWRREPDGALVPIEPDTPPATPAEQPSE